MIKFYSPSVEEARRDTLMIGDRRELNKLPVSH